MKSLTRNQSRAIEAKGNVLVMAGAGTGKTHTLVECCVRRLLDRENPASLDEILMVTFTEAAAGEMRRRIRERLEQAIKDDPGNVRLGEQLALVETARISTLHSFCLELVRDHFHELNLDPQVSVLPQERVRILAAETLEQVFERHYAGQSEEDDAVRQLAMYYGGYRDAAVRGIVMRVHDYIQTLPAPGAWLARQKMLLEQESPAHWQAWLLEAVSEWRSEWIERLLELPPGNPNAERCATILQKTPAKPGIDDAAAVLAAVLAADEERPKGRKTELRKPLEAIFDEAEFLKSLMPGGQTADPLKEDWCLVRPHLRTLLRLIEEFGQAFASAKRERGVVDFHDIEQLSLRLLWDADSSRPTAIAQQWRSKLRYIFVDEFQDINAAQDTILCALARDGADANRFLVGDLKQSIYRFRLADPRICRTYARRFGDDPSAGQVIPLNDNFRSRAGILDFANSVFELLMRPELGGVNYDDDARLRFARVSKGQQQDGESNHGPCVELLLRLTGQIEDVSDAGEG
ncbi:MAG: UvrD-helicase domain-containing protein, partial [Verrucomicrobiia bacterium]